MSIDGEEDIEALRKIGRIVAQTLRLMRERALPGMTTKALDEIGRTFLRESGAQSAPELFYQFPGATCISVGEEMAHGIPGDRVLIAGDLVNVDVSAELAGYVADTGGSFVVGAESDSQRELLEATRLALTAGMQAAKAGVRVNEIGRAIEAVADRFAYTVIRNLGSHGVGRSLHEEPEFIAGYYNAKDKRKLKAGQVITIEPFISTGALWADDKGDGWTLLTNPKYRTAQFEHTIVITAGAPLVMTYPD